MDAMSSGNEYDAEYLYTDMIEDICDGSKSHPNIKRREERYRISDCIKQVQ